MGKAYKTAQIVMLILAGGLLIFLVPALSDYFNPGSLALGSGFASVFILFCFLPDIVLANILGVVLVRSKIEPKDRLETLRSLVVGNSVLLGLAVILLLGVSTSNPQGRGITAFLDVPALLQSLLIISVPQITCIVAYSVWIRKESPYTDRKPN